MWVIFPLASASLPRLLYPNIAVVVIVVVTAALLAYLFYALVRPERF